MKPMMKLMKWNDNKIFGWHLVFSIKFLVTCLDNSGLPSLGVLKLSLNQKQIGACAVPKILPINKEWCLTYVRNYSSRQKKRILGLFGTILPLGVPLHPQILADHLTLSQPGGGRPSYGSAIKKTWRDYQKTKVQRVSNKILGMT